MYLVDGDDELGLLHTSQMLDRSRDTDGHVQLGSNDLCKAECLLVIWSCSLKPREPFQFGRLAASCLHIQRPRQLEMRQSLEAKHCQIPKTWISDENGSPAPRLSAKGSITAVNCSADLRARPPETTREAEDKSGLLDVVSSSDTNLVGPVTKKSRRQRTSRDQAVGTICDDILLPACAVNSSTSAPEPPNFALSNAVVRTLTIPTLSLSWLVLICKIAFPA